MNENPKNLWDPLNDTITTQTYEIEQQKLLKKMQWYKNKPYLLKVYLYIWIGVAAVSFILIFVTRIPQLVIGVIPLFWYYQSVLKSEEELILYLLCEKNKWAYNPERIEYRAGDFVTYIPEIFNYGYAQTINEQVWGTIENKNGNKAEFWNAEFEYTTGSGKNTRSHTEYICIFKLENPVAVTFSLTKAGLLSNFEEQIKTESNEFNSMFQIQCETSDTKTKEQIIKVLSPSVITRIIDFANTYKTKKIMFLNGIMIIVLKNNIWKTKYTNFFKQIAIDPRDETIFYTTLIDIAELPSEMVQFIS